MHKLLRGAIGAVRVLASRTILKIYCRSSSKYLAGKNTVGSIAKSFKARLRTESKIQDTFGLSILLLMGVKTWNIGATEGAIET